MSKIRTIESTIDQIDELFLQYLNALDPKNSGIKGEQWAALHAQLRDCWHDEKLPLEERRAKLQVVHGMIAVALLMIMTKDAKGRQETVEVFQRGVEAFLKLKLPEA